MKLLLSLLLAALFFSAVIPSAGARDAVSMDFFYDNLDPYGTWREVGDYGYCWQPRDVDADWRPYSDGRWVYTDAGWTWDSDEPFGWAVYHYGRWANVERHGWIWVPGTEWGPGWVSWRHSPRYVGWAPLPPEAFFLRAIGFSVWVDNYFDIGPGHYRFVENQDFGARRLNSVFVDQSQNLQIINQTTNVTNITYVNNVNNVIYNGGPGYDQLARQSRMPIQQYNLERRQDFDGDPRRQSAENLRSRVHGKSLSMLTLPVSEHASAPPPRLAEKAARTEVNHGWKNAGSTAEVNALRERMKGQSRVPDALPAKPRFERPDVPLTPRQDQSGRKPATTQPPPGTTKRDDNPRNPNAPPVTPERKPQSPDRTPVPEPAIMPTQPAPGVKPPPNTQRPPDAKRPAESKRPPDAPNPGGRNKKSETPPDTNPPPKVERKPEANTPPKPDRKLEDRPPQAQQPRTPIQIPRFPEAPRPARPTTPDQQPRPKQPESIKPPVMTPPPAIVRPPPVPPASPPVFVPPPIPPLPTAVPQQPQPGRARPEGRDRKKPASP